MKISINSIENINNFKYILAPVLISIGYYASGYLYNNKKVSAINFVEKDNNVLANTKICDNDTKLCSNTQISTKIIKKKETSNNFITEGNSLLLLNLINNLRETHTNYINHIIENRKIICNDYIKEKLSSNKVTINGKNREHDINQIYIKSLNMNDSINNILNHIEEIIKWTFWLHDEEELRSVYKNIVYHNKISVRNTLKKMNFNINLLPTIEVKKKLLDKLETLITEIQIYISDINIILTISDYIIKNNKILHSNEKIKNLTELINKIVKNNMHYYNMNMIETIKKIRLDINNINWMNYDSIEQYKTHYLSTRNINDIVNGKKLNSDEDFLDFSLKYEKIF